MELSGYIIYGFFSFCPVYFAGFISKAKRKTPSMWIADGGAVAWGAPGCGGDASPVQDELQVSGDSWLMVQLFTANNQLSSFFILFWCHPAAKTDQIQDGHAHIYVLK